MTQLLLEDNAPAIGLEYNPCPNGCIESDTTVAQGCDVIHGVPGEYRAVRCTACGLVRTSPRPSSETMGVYYPREYGPYQAGSSIPPGVGHRLADWINGVPNLEPGAVLEIGCASGKFLDRMRARRWRTFGVEICGDAAQLARANGHEVWSGSVEQMPEPAVRPDLIVGWMVLEHLHNPLAALRRLHSVAAPGALCAFTVPRFGVLGNRFLGRYWILLDLPRHLFHYEPPTLGAMLEQTGWEPVRFFHNPKSSFAFSSVARFARSKGWARASNLLENIAGNKKLRILRHLTGLLLGVTRQSGVLTVWARRKDS